MKSVSQVDGAGRRPALRALAFHDDGRRAGGALALLEGGHADAAPREMSRGEEGTFRSPSSCCHGERSRLQLHFKVGVTENMIDCGC